jgi:hypothetical protein
MAGGECCDDAGRTVLRKVRLDAEFSYSILLVRYTQYHERNPHGQRTKSERYAQYRHGYMQYHGCTRRLEHIQHCLTWPSASE